jgi:16S rRNA U1498 N3-methylase RsmE
MKELGKLGALPRLFTPLSVLSSSTTKLISLSSTATFKLNTVLRSRVGDQVLAFNNRDGEWLCSVERGGRHLSVLRRVRAGNDTNNNNNTLPLVAFAPLRAERSRILIEKAVEVGVSALICVATARSGANVEAVATTALEVNDEELLFEGDDDAVLGATAAKAIYAARQLNGSGFHLRARGLKTREWATAAVEQCGRITLPRVSSPILSLIEFLAAWNIQTSLPPILSSSLLRRGVSGNSRVESSLASLENIASVIQPLLPPLPRLLLITDLTAINSICTVLNTVPRNIHVGILVGPEGGWSKEETDIFESLTKMPNSNFIRVTLGVNSILRAETAVIAALVHVAAAREKWE